MSEKMKLVPVEPTRQVLHSMALRHRHDFGLLSQSEQESIITSMSQLYEEALSAAPSQEVEPVAWMDDGSTGGFGQQKLRVITNETKLSMAHTLSSAYSIPLYLSPPTAEKADADMKRRCVEVCDVKHDGYEADRGVWNMKDPVQAEYAGYQRACREIQARIESLPISDMGREKP
jgi:hypothetical protein